MVQKYKVFGHFYFQKSCYVMPDSQPPFLEYFINMKFLMFDSFPQRPVGYICISTALVLFTFGLVYKIELIFNYIGNIIEHVCIFFRFDVRDRPLSIARVYSDQTLFDEPTRAVMKVNQRPAALVISNLIPADEGDWLFLLLSI